MAEPRFLGGRYDLGEVLGHGGMAEVRIGIDRRLGRTVAVKTLRPDLATDPIFQARFRREAQSAASLNHPSVVSVYDTGEETFDGVSVPYIVMEYVEGRTLRDVLREGRRILPERAMEITADILDALEYSHRAGIIHRDIKPANVMLTPSGDVKVMDFGIARAVADASATMTQTAAVIGTAQYLSPEQARGESVDARSDIYSTGCLLYELMTGRPPFVGDSPVSVAYQHVREEPRPPSMLDPEVPPVADAITLKALQKKPLDRYQSAAEMREDIERALSGQRVNAPVVPIDATARFLPPDEPPDATMAGDWHQPEPDEGPDRGRKAAYVMLVIAILFVLGVAGFIGFNMLGGDGAPKTVVAPTLIGKTEEQARTILAQSQLRPGQTKSAGSDSAPKGQIIAQSPQPGASVQINSVVDITVSSGKPTVPVPEVVGKQIAEARTVLATAGFKVVDREDKEASSASGTVTRIDPSEGSVVPKGSTVTIYFSSGLAEVPDVRQQSLAEAEARLGDAGFKARKVWETTSDSSEGTVIRQVPNPGQRREIGSTVTIVVARAPAPEPPPKPEPTRTPEPDPEPTTPPSTPTPEPTTPSPTDTGFPDLPGIIPDAPSTTPAPAPTTAPDQPAPAQQAPDQPAPAQP
ncbi:Stk1 family PASTA domain-containing Ser/Thr kinase [Actinopolymorpha alba]|uniref:Stk1 family PASTA domain-containing Ser/Thr kinase n=1 Tax=Actinopolymorpha alba TaxID=533267 RepID=UPI0003761155|nr:Stk1 family PASTA domain-containing Ser/Thr kinase [Actinopolymorpha alba]